MEPYQTAAQLKIDQAEMKRIVNQLAEQMKLRQWCVEQAVKICAPPNADVYAEKEYIESVTKYFYDFVTNTPDTE